MQIVILFRAATYTVDLQPDVSSGST